jgi:hypothetical protein
MSLTNIQSEIVSFKKDVLHKAFIITLNGYAKPERANNFIDMYNHHVSKVNPNQYTLIVDSTELKTFPKEVLPVLEKSYQLYMKTGFKKVVMVFPDHITGKMQLRRVGKIANFDGQFVDSLQEGLDIAKSLK